MKLRGFLLVNFFLFLALSVQSQVTIGVGSPPEEGALLQLKEGDGVGVNSTRGLGLPRVKLTDLNNLYPMFTDDTSGGYNEGIKADIDAIHTGLTVYNINSIGCSLYPGVYTWDGGEWVSLSLNSDEDVSGYSFDRIRDSLALVAFYNNTGGGGWIDKTNWLSNEPITEWAGVTCIEKCVNGKVEIAVTGIHFENNNLVGQLPANLKNLLNLTELSLPMGQLNSSLPAWLSDLTKLQTIDFRSNQFSGTIPAGLGNLTDLVILDLQDNQLSGAIPTGLGSLTKIIYLDLAYNYQLVGAIPSDLGSLTNLMFFDLQNCSLSGNIPSSFSGLTNLISINIVGNQLTGNIPTNLLSAPINEFCPQYQSDGITINLNPWTNYNGVGCP